MTTDYPTEVWRDVVGYEGIYQVSDHGRVKRVSARKKITKVDRILKPSATPKKRKWVVLCNERSRKCMYIHTLVARAFIGECPNGMEINHIDTDPTNNHVSNLEYLTHLENMRHAVRMGVMSCGEKHYASTVTQDKVNDIRADYALNKPSVTRLAQKHSVSYSIAWDIVHYKTWKLTAPATNTGGARP